MTQLPPRLGKELKEDHLGPTVDVNGKRIPTIMGLNGFSRVYHKSGRVTRIITEDWRRADAQHFANVVSHTGKLLNKSGVKAYSYWTKEAKAKAVLR